MITLPIIIASLIALLTVLLALRRRPAGDAPASTAPATARSAIRALDRQWRGLRDALAATRRDAPDRARQPWFLVLGTAGAGKTSLLAGTGLGLASVGGVSRTGGREWGSTATCDWWHGEAALFIDTAGAYLDDPRTRPAWRHLLELIRRERRDPALAGVLLCVPVGDLLRKGHEVMTAEILTIRARLDELTRHLGVALPLHLVFTRCDTIGGFKDFFAGITREEQVQVLGATLPWPGMGDLPGICASAHQRLAESLAARRLQVMANAHGDEAKRKCFQFPLQFRALERLIGACITTLSQDGPQETASLRGFYFTSCFHARPPDPAPAAAPPTPDGPGEPSIFIDPGRTDARLAGIGRAGTDAHQGFFLHDLFAQVVLPDRVLARPTRRARRRQRRMRILMLVAIPLLALAANAWLAWRMIRDVAAITALDGPVQQVLTAAHPSPGDAGGVLDACNRLEEHLAAWRGKGDPRLEPLVAAATALLDGRLLALLVEPCARVVHDDLERARVQLQLQGREAGTALQDEVYELYRVYRMMGGDLAFTAPAVRAVLETRRRWTAGIDTAAGAARRTDEEAARRHLDRYLAVRSRGDRLRIAVDQHLVESISRELGEGLWLRQAYEDILRSAAGRHGIADAGTLLNGPQRDALALGQAFSLAFSQCAWDEEVRAAIGEKAEALERTFQELGHPRPATHFAQRLTARFQEDHQRHWLTLLTTTGAAPVGDLREVPERIARLSGGGSPIPALMHRVFRELALRTGGPAAPAGPQDLPWLEPALLALGELRRDVQGFLAASEAGRRSADLERLRTLVERGNAVRQRIEDALAPLPGDHRQAVLTGFGNLLRGLLAPLHQEIAQEQDHLWHEQVYRPFADHCAGRFPFRNDARDEVAQADFARLFNPLDGRIGAVLQAIDGLHALRLLDRPLVTLSADGERTVRAAAGIGRILFAGNSPTIQAPFVLTLMQREGVEDVVFSIGAQDHSLYDRPDARFALAFQQGEPARSARITIRVGRDRWRDHTILKQEWAVLRVLRAADPRLQPRGGHLLTWSFSDDHQAVFKACALLEDNGFEQAVVGDLLTAFTIPEHPDHQTVTP